LKSIDHISETDLEKIEHYLSGELGPAEHEAFAARIAAEPVLQEQVKQTRLLLLGIKEAVLQEKMQGFHQELAGKKQSAPVRKLYSWKTLAIAASLVILAGVGLLWMMKSAPDNEKLYAAYFEPDPGLITTMSVTGEYEFNRAMVDYKYGNYKAALERWLKMEAAGNVNDTLSYFTGAAFMASGEPGKAIPYLEKVCLEKESAFGPDACWYLGLSLLKEGRKQEAIAALQQSTHPQKDELLQNLNR
jgi:tetratricopeptide (TPR) repeat protein